MTALILQLKIDEKAFQTPSGRKFEVTVYSSNYHVELNPSDAGIYDRIVVQEIIKELAQTQQIGKSKHPFKGFHARARSAKFLVAVILDADRLSKDAQHGLRRTMEKYSANLRLILCCNSSSRIIGPIKSRCFSICVPAPSDAEIEECAKKVATSENHHCDARLLKSVVNVAEGNNRRALLALESAVAKNSVVAEKPDWELCVDEIASQILREQSPASLLKLRANIYELLTHSIPPVIIVKSLLWSLLPKISAKPETIARDIIDAAAFYEHRLTKGSKAILHLEAFVAKTMSILSAGNN